MTKVRLAVLGGGHLGRIHTRLLQTHPDVELVGVVEPLAETRQKIHAEFSVTTFEHHADLAGRIDGAVVATTTDAHQQVSRELLAQGVHLFVEKPLTTSAALAEELIRLAQSRQLVLQVGHVERFNPAWRAAAHHLHRPRFIESVRSSGYTFRSTDIGVVLDLMIHDLDLVLSIVRSEVVAVDAVGATLFGPHEDLAHAHLRFANGCVANLNVSRTSFQAQRSMQVLTDRAYVGIDFAAGKARVIRPDKQLVRGKVNIHELSRDQKEHLKTHLFSELLPLEELAVEPSNAIQDEQREFVRCIRLGRAPTVGAEHARDCLTIVERILQCIQQPQPARLPSILTPPVWSAAPEEPSAERRRAG